MTSAIECIARPLLAALLAALASCGGGDRPSVLLITVDTLRADRLGCYGYGRDTTPNLDRLAEESARFTKAYSHAPVPVAPQPVGPQRTRPAPRGGPRGAAARCTQ